MSEWVRELTRDEAIAIHGASLARFGGLAGIRGEGLLESALAQPFMSFGGRDLHPTVAEKHHDSHSDLRATIPSSTATSAWRRHVWVRSCG